VWAADLVHQNVSVIVASGPPAVVAAKAATTSIPIVFITGADPIRFGFVTNFSRPSANLTGVWMVTTVLAEKRLQLVHELLPRARTVAMVVNPTSPVAQLQIQDAQSAARALGLDLLVESAASEDVFEKVFASIVHRGAEALFVSADPFFSSRRAHFVELAVRYSIPAIYEFREFVKAGGLISYGAVLSDGYHKGGLYAGRILSGAKPSELPVEQTNKFELVVNLKTAKSLGLEVPDKLLALTDEVIE
jgi:putative ABC transport system substrate-binding protein